MSGHLEERLREAAALGDLEEVQALVRKGVAVDAQNEINGWTCLHWACKRNHIEVVAYLLDSGASKEIFTANGELAADLTSREEIRKLLGVEEHHNQEVNDLKLPVSANDLTNSLSCTDKEGRDSLLDTPREQTSTAITYLPEGKPDPCLPATQIEDICTNVSLHSDKHYEGDFTAPFNAGVTACTTPTLQGCPVYPSPAGHNRVLFSSAASRQHVPQQANGSSGSAAQPLHLLLPTGNFPYKTQELVLKVRVQNPKDNDFIEIELDRQELTYQDLLRVSCCELGINPEQVEKIRKLPNTLVRKDKDVARLQDFQELELVLERSISSPFKNAAAPTAVDRPCYNTKAAKLTY